MRVTYLPLFDLRDSCNVIYFSYNQYSLWNTVCQLTNMYGYLVQSIYLFSYLFWFYNKKWHLKNLIIICLIKTERQFREIRIAFRIFTILTLWWRKTHIHTFSVPIPLPPDFYFYILCASKCFLLIMFFFHLDMLIFWKKKRCMFLCIGW